MDMEARSWELGKEVCCMNACRDRWVMNMSPLSGDDDALAGVAPVGAVLVDVGLDTVAPGSAALRTMDSHSLPGGMVVVLSQQPTLEVIGVSTQHQTVVAYMDEETVICLAVQRQSRNTNGSTDGVLGQVGWSVLLAKPGSEVVGDILDEKHSGVWLEAVVG
jgi:hypothetical protein